MNAGRIDTVVEDVEFMLSAGEHPDRVADRVGMKRASLERILFRAGRRDLARRIYGAARVVSSSGDRS